jgi:hypothetical protein
LVIQSKWPDQRVVRRADSDGFSDQYGIDECYWVLLEEGLQDFNARLVAAPEAALLPYSCRRSFGVELRGKLLAP